MGGISVAPARWPAFHSFTSRVSMSAAPESISCCASAGVISRTCSWSGIVCAPRPFDPAIERAAQRVERQQRALQPSWADLYSKVVENILPAELRDVAQRHSAYLVGEHAR